MRLEQQAVFGGPFGTASDARKFRSDRATLRERSDIGCVLLTTLGDNAESVASACGAFGLDLPLAPGPVSLATRRTALWLTPRSWLIHCDLDEETDLVERINAAFPDKRAHSVLFTDAVCWMELSGPASLDLLTEGGFVSLERDSLPVGHVKRTLIAQVPVVLFHQAPDTWLLAVERSRAIYFAQWLSAAAATSE